MEIYLNEKNKLILHIEDKKVIERDIDKYPLTRSNYYYAPNLKKTNRNFRPGGNSQLVDRKEQIGRSWERFQQS